SQKQALHSRPVAEDDQSICDASLRGAKQNIRNKAPCTSRRLDATIRMPVLARGLCLQLSGRSKETGMMRLTQLQRLPQSDTVAPAWSLGIVEANERKRESQEG